MERLDDWARHPSETAFVERLGPTAENVLGVVRFTKFAQNMRPLNEHHKSLFGHDWTGQTVYSYQAHLCDQGRSGEGCLVESTSHATRLPTSCTRVRTSQLSFQSKRSTSTRAVRPRTFPYTFVRLRGVRRLQSRMEYAASKVKRP